ncbi:hypothetical protein FAVG1_00314 [Fusarium avenaceum]|nr:hypothetical protein FAVG1_00314 [Fusarium avenaceum]
MPGPTFKAPRPADALLDDDDVFGDAAQNDVVKTSEKLAVIRGRIVSFRRGLRSNQDAVSGKDPATLAGYDPSDRNRMATLLQKSRKCLATTEDMRKDISLRKAAIRELESRAIASSDSDETSRQGAALRVIKFLVRSPTNFHTLLRGLGVEITPEIRSALQSNLSQMSGSQTEQLIQQSRQSDDYVALQQRFDQQNDQLNMANREAEVSKRLAESVESKYADAEKRASENQRKAFDYERSYGRAKQELQKANQSIGRLEGSLQEANSNKLVLQKEVQEANSSKLALKKEVQTLKNQAEELGQTESDLRRKISERDYRFINLERAKDRLEQDKATLTNEAEANRKTHSDKVQDLDSRLKAAEKKAVHLGEKVQETDSELQETRTDLERVTTELFETKGSLQSVKGQVTKLTEDVKALEGNNSELHNSLEGKNRQIHDLKAQITQRDQVIRSQVDQASIFLRHLSIGVETQVWHNVAEKVLVDSSRTSATLIQWRPWKIFPSWSPDLSLDIRHDGRSLDAIALDVLATMDVKSVDTKDLLGSLQAMQDAIPESSMSSAIKSLLLGSFTKSVDDPRLHLMHRVAMCQIANLLAPTEALQSFKQALDVVDPRVNLLVNALRAYGPEHPFQLGDSINFPNLTLVGFNRNPEGVIALDLTGREICWVDCTRLHRGDGIKATVEAKVALHSQPRDEKIAASTLPSPDISIPHLHTCKDHQPTQQRGKDIHTVKRHFSKQLTENYETPTATANTESGLYHAVSVDIIERFGKPGVDKVEG